MTKFLLILVLAAWATVPVFADSLDDELTAFKAALKQSAASHPDSTRTRMESAMPFAPMVDEENGEANLEAMILQAMAQDPSPDVQAAGQALLADLAARKKARLDAFAAKVDGVLKDLPDRLAKAQKPEDIDAVLADIQSVQAPQRGYGMDQGMQSLVNKVNACYQTVAQWQDYLSAKNNGNTQAALNSLSNLLNNRQPDAPILIPRSQLLATQASLTPAMKASNAGPSSPSEAQAAAEAKRAVQIQERAALISGIKTLDDIDPALAKIQAQYHEYIDNGETHLVLYAGVYADAKNGLPIKLDVFTNEPSYGMNLGSSSQDLSRIKSMLLLYLLPIYLHASADQQPMANETSSDYLNRLAQATESKGDWPALKEVVLTQQKLGYSGTSLEFCAALDEETAGQYALAVQSYLQALRLANPNLPAKLIGERLDAIKKDHPDEYAQAEKRSQEPTPMPAWAYRNMVYPPSVMPMQPGATNSFLQGVTLPPRATTPRAPVVIPASTNGPSPVSPTPAK